uniref:Uncharacterized protein n=1 Tax=Hyaloperonospora arabidopsidis (strain Emoy2) TaxID=559515 RepID=M4BTQ2_HYAAE
MRGRARPGGAGQGANFERLQHQADGLTTQMGQMRLNTPVCSTFGGAGGAGGEESCHSSNVSMPTASPGTPYSVAPTFQMAPRPPNIKALVCERFDDKKRYPGQGLGFGFEDFEWRGEHAIATDIATYGSNWTDFPKMMMMVKYMAARPAKLFHDDYES